MGKKKSERPENPFLADNDHYGPMTVRQLVELVSSGEFPDGLDTRICIGDVEGNRGVVTEMVVTWHRPGDVVLSIDANSGDEGY